MKENCLYIVLRMTTKRKHNEVTLKSKYEALEEFDKNRPNREAIIQFNVPRSTLSTRNQPISTISKFSEKPTEVIADGDDENEDEGSNEQIAHPRRNEVDERIKSLNRLSQSQRI